MKKKYIIMSALLSSLSLFTGSLAANEGNRGCSSCNGGRNYSSNYGTSSSAMENTADGMGSGSAFAGPRALKTDSVEKFKGIVKNVNRVQYPDGTQIQITVETPNGDVMVLLGPARYLDQNKIKFEVGDKVTIHGYHVMVTGREMIMASEVQKNGNSVKLRSANRQPMWNSNRTQ